MNQILIILSMILGVIVLVGGTIIIGAIINGFVINILWGWFMVPIFDLPSISIIQAIGISLVIAWFTSHVDTNKEHETDNKKSITLLIIKPIIFLLVGYIVHLLAS